MKREAIANKGIWTGKKHYILNVFNNEGVQYAKPKLKMQGIEAVRSSTPAACRENIKKALEVIMNETEDAAIEFIENFRNEFVKLPFEQVAFPRSVQNIDKWRNGDQPKPACPIHVRGTIVFNTLLKQKNLTNKYNPVVDGDKIKFCYLLLPNNVQQNVISTSGILPPEFGLEQFIDYDTQFNKSFLEPLKTILDKIGWKTEKSFTVEDFFQ